MQATSWANANVTRNHSLKTYLMKGVITSSN